MAALLATEQIACPPDFEVEGRDAEAAPQVAELLDRGEAFLRDRRQIVFRRNQKVRVRRSVRSPDPPAKLVQLREPVPIGAIDHDRVGVRNVESVLDDRRRE